MMLSENLNDFVLSRLVCPISKKPLTRQGDDFVAPSGLRYPKADFRVNLDSHKVWTEGQEHMEEEARKEVADPSYNYKLADEEVQDVYAKIKIEGDVLDVGGWYGLLPTQIGLDKSRYAALDPMACTWEKLPAQGAFIRHYSAIKDVPRIAANAEFLPFADASFDIVHMRSCVDHFSNPPLALKEAFRVLRPGGRVVIMLALEGTYKKTNLNFRQKVKSVIIALPFGWHLLELLHHDHHVFHPTRDGLYKLVENADFKVEQEAWPKAWHNVIYVDARRP